MPTPARNKERRQLNVSIGKERRTSQDDRRHCPDCGKSLRTGKRRVAGGTVTVTQCGACGYSRTGRQTDAEVLTLKLTWGLTLEPHHGGLAAVLPPELKEALKVRAGDELVLSPLTSPLGSQGMKWSVTLHKSKK